MEMENLAVDLYPLSKDFRVRQDASLETVTFDLTVSAFGFHRHGCRLSVDVKL
jgi:hypothetical protein